jgi:exodeoxyribonuclease-1
MLDVVRMTRALRPDSIEWPVDANGKAVNKLELLAKVNNLTHTKAHDALSDVVALIDLAKHIKTKQQKLFDYLFAIRDKKKIAELVHLKNPQPFLYTSGRYDPAHEKTTVAYPVSAALHPGSVVVYDLRYDPSPFLNATPKQLAEILFANWDARQQAGFLPLPVKELSFTKCPAVAPLGVLDDASKNRLSIDLDSIQKHINILAANPGFADTIHEAYQLKEPYAKASDVEHTLYDGFINDKDKPRINAVRNADASTLADFHPSFVDERLEELLFRYKARQFPTSLSEDEHEQWESYRAKKLQGLLPAYLESIERLRRNGADAYLLEELHLWAESIVPNED